MKWWSRLMRTLFRPKPQQWYREQQARKAVERMEQRAIWAADGQRMYGQPADERPKERDERDASG